MKSELDGGGFSMNVICICRKVKLGRRHSLRVIFSALG